jgi:hypothetical protein
VTLLVSLTRFKRLLTRARLDVRRLAHTLHIPPAQPEFYNGPQAGWLRDILDRLPSLQALIVSNLSFFDHQSLQSIHQSTGAPIRNPSKYGLRLLIASECENTTASSLATALTHFPDLIYLDLSSTQGSRSPYVLRQFGSLTELRVLKLRNCGLRDDDMYLLSFSKQLRSLDVSQNFLSERGVSKLIQLLPTANLPFTGDNSYNGDTSPAARRYSGMDLPTRVMADGLESFVANRLTGQLDGHLFIEEGLPSYFTHLYLAENWLTLDGLSRLLSYPRFQHLDCGSLNCSSRPFELLSPRSPGAESKRLSDPPELECISPALFVQAFRNVRSLRIHHSAITSYPFSGTDIATETTEQCFELHSEDLRYELDSTEIIRPGTIFELDDTSISFTPEPDQISDPPSASDDHATFESPEDVGSSLVPALSKRLKEDAVNGTVRPESELQTRPSIPRKSVPPRISVSSHSDHSLSLPAGPERYRYKYAVGPDRRWSEASYNKSKSTSIRETIEEVRQRRHRTEARERHPGRFKPSMLPNLKILTLTDVPSTTQRRDVTDALILFMQECAEEEELARLEDLERRQDGYASPTGNEEASSTFKLQRLILEISSVPELTGPPRSPRRSPGRSSRGTRESFSKSSTEDPDSEMFMQASETDFSFFGEDDGGLLTSDGRIDAPLVMEDGIMIVNGDGNMIDVVSELSGFRRERKARHEAALRFDRCKIETALLGHWRGEVKVVKEVVA